MCSTIRNGTGKRDQSRRLRPDGGSKEVDLVGGARRLVRWEVAQPAGRLPLVEIENLPAPIFAHELDLVVPEADQGAIPGDVNTVALF